MIRLDIQMRIPGCADGTYRIRAKGCIAAALYWADKHGALPDWTPFAYIPVSPGGTGEFRFTGHRAIPRDATHVLAHGVRSDMTATEETIAELPNPDRQEPVSGAVRLGVITDLHLSGKPWTVRKALHMAGDSSAVLCAGDMVNDGLPEQYALLHTAISQVLPDTPLLAVAGNHDYPTCPLPQISCGICDYPTLQDWLLRRAERMGHPFELDESGAYAVNLHGIDVIGLNVASHYRRLAFKKDGQLMWLARHLDAVQAARHIILCHAPLSAHNPQRQGTDKPPYFSRDSHLQEILDAHRNIIFLSGHTHLSFNSRKGCVDQDPERGNFYVNCGSIRPTTLKPDEPLQPKEWADGNIVWLDIAEDQIEITAVSLESGQRISRGYYRYPLAMHSERAQL